MFQANYSLFDSALHFFRPCHVCRWVSVSYSTAGFKNLRNHANLRMHPSRFLLWRSVTPEQTQQNGKDSIIIFQRSSESAFFLKICDIRNRGSGAFETWWFIGFSNKHVETACLTNNKFTGGCVPPAPSSLLPLREARVSFYNRQTCEH